MEVLPFNHLPHSDAFNPALIEWRGRIITAYRVGTWNSVSYFCELDGDYRPVGQPRKFTFPGAISAEDIRFFVHRDQLHFSFVACFPPSRYRTGIGTLNDDLTVREVRLIQGTHPLLSEKNWIFFPHGDELFFTYAMSDGVHQVHRLKSDRCEPAYRTEYEPRWKWGIARGGTHLMANDGLWYGFFHGTDFHAEGLERRYYLGAYAVSPEPPFAIVKMSGQPLFTPNENFYRPPDRLPDGRWISVIFPAGLLRKDDAWTISAGYNDHAARLIRISHRELESNLVDVSLREDATHAPDSLSQRPKRRGTCARVHWFPLDQYWQDTIQFVEKHADPDETLYADVRLQERLGAPLQYTDATADHLQTTLSWFVVHKDNTSDLAPEILNVIKRHYTAVFANEVFVVFTNKPLPGFKPAFDPDHELAFWAKINERPPVGLSRFWPFKSLPFFQAKR